MKIQLTSVYVDDQEKALKFYTEILGFVKKTDVSAGDYRWLTVVSPENPDGSELLLEPNANHASKSYQEAIFSQNIPATMFFVDNFNREYQRLKDLGVKFITDPRDIGYSIFVVFEDTCGNLLQITELRKSAPNSSISEKSSRKDIAESFLKMISTGDIREAFESYVSKDFKHHNPFNKGDRETLMLGMEEQSKKMAEMLLEVQHSVEEGALVTVHSKITLDKGSKILAAVHIFRFENDKIVEFWDIVQEQPEKSPNENGMF
jgi:predicted SnoaL-like aldol condensation-catalyzing enzyme/catechol 2,3-dioxygenase-like lactoylglutathione lyase family enzyme